MKKALISLAVLILLAVLSFGIYYLYNTNNSFSGSNPAKSSQTGIDIGDCPNSEDPVCGMDGVTYKNSCFADLNSANIDYAGSCSSPTIMTDVERKYLVWLLRERENSGLEAVLIKHVKTNALDCKDCYTLFYTWNENEIAARIEVNNDSVVSALDTTGYDILNNEQGEPVVFEELIP